MDTDTAATLVAALAVGASGGFFGSWVSTRAAAKEAERQREHDRAESERQREFERRERARDRQINAADDFLRAIAQVSNTTVPLLRVRGKDDEPSRLAAAQRIMTLLDEAAMHAERLRIVFAPQRVSSAAYYVIETGVRAFGKFLASGPGTDHLDDPEVDEELKAANRELQDVVLRQRYFSRLETDCWRRAGNGRGRSR